MQVLYSSQALSCWLHQWHHMVNWFSQKRHYNSTSSNWLILHCSTRHGEGVKVLDNSRWDEFCFAKTLIINKAQRQKSGSRPPTGCSRQQSCNCGLSPQKTYFWRRHSCDAAGSTRRGVSWAAGESRNLNWHCGQHNTILSARRSWFVTQVVNLHLTQLAFPVVTTIEIINFGFF